MLVAMPIDPRNLTQCASPFCEKLCLQLQHIQDGAGRPGYKGNHKKKEVAVGPAIHGYLGG